MNAWPVVVLALIVLVLFWRGAGRSAVFIVRVQGGKAVRESGQVTGAFLSAVSEICRDAQLSAGEIRGVPRGGRLTLQFSGEFPPEVRQHLLNLWANQGWSHQPQRR